jgi:hypothetical protein
MMLEMKMYGLRNFRDKEPWQYGVGVRSFGDISVSVIRVWIVECRAEQ